MAASTMRRLATPVVGALAAVVVCLGISACGSEAGSIAAQARSGDGKGYVSGDGSIERVAPDKRSGPLTLTGTTLQGTPWAVSDARNQVLVLNVWG
ncbi:MAG TPA: TlpA family protein disulfide reductase, partial [Dermatophilaceae bacterium]